MRIGIGITAGSEIGGRGVVPRTVCGGRRKRLFSKRGRSLKWDSGTNTGYSDCPGCPTSTILAVLLLHAPEEKGKGEKDIEKVELI